MNLVLLTISYPFSNEEAFLEPELKSCYILYDKIHIYTLAPQGIPKTRFLPDNAKVFHVNNQSFFIKIKAVSLFFHFETIKEVFFVHKRFHYSFRRTFSMLYHNYFILSPQFVSYLQKEDINNSIFYSYWLSHLAYALVLFKRKNSLAFCISRSHRFDNFIECKSSFFRKAMLEHLDFIYPISNSGLFELQHKVAPLFKTVKSKFMMYHLGVNLPSHCNPSLSSEYFTIVSCSFIWKIKRLDIIIDALKQISNINIKWIHFGSGQDFDSIYSYAQSQLSNSSNIQFSFRGQTDHSAIMSFYSTNHVDLFVNSSDHEGIPVSIMEAMSFGIPCVARNVGGNSELIFDNFNGFLLNPNSNSIDYCHAINQYYGLSNETINMFRNNSKKTITNSFLSPDVFVSFHYDNLHLFRETHQ